jgi:hypothetical protein
VHIPRCVNANIDANADCDTYAYAATDSHGDATSNAANTDSAVLLPIPVSYGYNSKWISDNSSGNAGRAQLIAAVKRLEHIKSSSTSAHKDHTVFTSFFRVLTF